MKIQITKISEDDYVADCLDLPGAPPVGVGKTEAMALACLFYRTLFSSPEGPIGGSWTRHLHSDQPIEINGVLWEYPDSFRR